MEKVRVIHAVVGDLLKEAVVFTKDMDCPAKDFFLPKYEIYTDEVIDDVLPNTFPYEEVLVKE